MTARPSITPCIFGTTKGFEIQTLTRIPLNVDDLDFAITRSEVELSGQHPCIKIFRKKVKSEIFTWIGLYWKAFEIGFSRDGGYYGAGLWLEGITVNSRDAIQVLFDLANQVEALAITNGRFEQPLLSIIDRMQIPLKLVPLNESSKSYLRGGLNIAAIPSAFIGQLEQGTVREMVDWAQNDVLADKFRALIIAPEQSFPKGASSRLERYNDLNDVVRKLESDLSLRIARLEADKLALQQHVETLKNDVLNAEKDAKKWKELYAKKSTSFQKTPDHNDLSHWSWTDFLKYSTVFVVIVVLMTMAGLLVRQAKERVWPSEHATESRPLTPTALPPENSMVQPSAEIQNQIDRPNSPAILTDEAGKTCDGLPYTSLVQGCE